jgi:hypothetical protein
MDNLPPVSITEPWPESEWKYWQARWTELLGPRWAWQQIQAIAKAPARERAERVAKADAIASKALRPKN